MRRRRFGEDLGFGLGDEELRGQSISELVLRDEQYRCFGLHDLERLSMSLYDYTL